MQPSGQALSLKFSYLEDDKFQIQPESTMSDLNDSVNMSRWSRLTTECRLWLHSAFTSNGTLSQVVSCLIHIFVVFLQKFPTFSSN